MELRILYPYIRRADMGHDYTYLTLTYPTWGRELHKSGNTLDNSKLETIAVEGIIRWYMKETSPYDIDYPYLKKIDSFLQNLKMINYYDFIKLSDILKDVKMEVTFTIKKKFSEKDITLPIGNHYQLMEFVKSENTNEEKIISLGKVWSNN